MPQVYDARSGFVHGRCGTIAAQRATASRMGRPRAFDRKKALQAATDLFWAHGYEACSVRQLCEAMGIQSGSFYATFHSKEACFAAALRHYLDTMISGRRPEETGHAMIRRWFQQVAVPSRRGKGCLLVNSAVEFPSLEGSTQALVQERLRALEIFFVTCLGDRPDAKEDAALLAAASTAINVLVRSRASAATVRRVAERVLTLTGI